MCQSSRLVEIAEIPGEKIVSGVGVPDHLRQTNYAEICILVTKYIQKLNKTQNSGRGEGPKDSTKTELRRS